MAKVFRPSSRESSILSRIESSKEHARRKAISGIRDNLELLANAIATKLIENELVETTNKNAMEAQIAKELDRMLHLEDFDIDYQIAPFRGIAANPHPVSTFILAFVIEKLIDHKDVVDIYGSDEDIYTCIHTQVARFIQA